MVRPRITLPLTLARADESALGRDDEIRRIRIQRLRNDLFAHVWAIGIRGIDEIDTQLERAPQHPQRLAAISRRTPHARARQAHRTKAEPADAKITAEHECPGCCGGGTFNRGGLRHGQLLMVIRLLEYPRGAYSCAHPSVGGPRMYGYNGLGGLIVLIADIYAIVNIFQSNASTDRKVLWTVLVILLPVLG